MSRTCSIWLLPDRDTGEYRSLDDAISEAARSYPDAPDFEPHVTVLGGVSTDAERADERARELAESRGPFELEFTAVSCSTTTHQCVFRLIDPSVELLRLYREAAESFGTDGGMYVPHLSLVYSDMRLEDRVEAVRSFEATPLPESVRTDAIAVVDTAGSVPEWETIAEHPL